MKTSGSNTTVYVYSQNRLIAEYLNGAFSEEYIYLGHRMIAEYAGGTLYYHHGDHLSDRMITDASGNKVGEQAHYPFGETWYSNNTTTKFHLTSYERDPESGNDYARHRFHVNRLGRFSSADPVDGCGRNPQGLNRFSYVGNDPIDRTDPSGQSWCWDWPDLCGWDDPNFGAPPDDEGDTGMKDSGGGCDPSLPEADCVEPPQPPPRPCDVYLLAYPVTVTRCSLTGPPQVAKMKIKGLDIGDNGNYGRATFEDSGITTTSSGGVVKKDEPYRIGDSRVDWYQKIWLDSKGNLTWSLSYKCDGHVVDKPATTTETYTCK